MWIIHFKGIGEFVRYLGTLYNNVYVYMFMGAREQGVK